ncbi:MAG TPA: phage baseplate assembly protein V [Trichocoleus sp.]
MDSIVGVMKKVAEQEVQRLYTTELGLVTAVFPHAAESDKDNYQCSIKLKNKKHPDGKDFELRKVPIATPHLGLANIPNVGDLVLVTFIGGDLNAPVVIGRLYNDADQPPVNKEQEFLLQHSLAGGGSLKLDTEGTVTLTSKDEKSTVTVKDGQVAIAADKSTITLESGTITITNGTCKITLENGGITLDAASNPITLKSAGSIKLGDAATGSVQVGGRAVGNAVADNDDILMTTHTHVGNLGAPCPVMVPTEKINSIQAKARNAKVG